MLHRMIHGVEHRPVYVPHMKHGIVRAWVRSDYVDYTLKNPQLTAWIPTSTDVYRLHGYLYIGTNCTLTVEDAIVMAEAIRSKRLAELKEETDALQRLVFHDPAPPLPLPEDFTPPAD